MAAFLPILSKRPFQPKSPPDQFKLTPLYVLKGAEIITSTKRRRPMKKTKTFLWALGLTALASLAFALWVMAQEQPTAAGVSGPDVYDAIAGHPSVQAYRSQVCQARKLASLENRYRADAETQLVEMRTRAAQAEARLAALKGKVAYTDVKAPSDGIISAVHIKTIGAVVDAGAVMAEIVPD